MAPAMKLTIKWEEGEDDSNHHVIKLTLPRKWKEGPVSKIKDQFVESYNEKFGASKLNPGDVHLLASSGHALNDEDIVAQVLQPGDHVRVKPGKPKAVARAIAHPTPVTDKDTNVSSSKAVQAAAAKGFDYSKWDRLDLSDDDGVDCHPNIDVNSWKRLMGQKRIDRREKEEEKIAAFKAKIEKHQLRVLEISAKIQAGDDDPQLLVDVKDAQESVEKYQEKLEHFLAHRKLVAEDLCDVAENATVVSENAAMTPLVPTMPSPHKSPVGPQAPVDEALEYDDFIKKYRKTVDTFAALRSDDASEAYLMEHPEVLHEHSEGYLLLLTLHTCMTHLEEKAKKAEHFTEKNEKAFKNEELAVARQHLLIQFVMTLAKGKNCDPRDMIRPFFRKTKKNSVDRVEGFEDDLVAFVERIRNRAKEKMANGEPSPLAKKPVEDEKEYEPAGLGPGGLDPNEVLPTLPQEMQDAFVEQDTDKLKACLMSLSDEEAQYHMQRCMDSGLWNQGTSEEE